MNGGRVRIWGATKAVLKAIGKHAGAHMTQILNKLVLGEGDRVLGRSEVDRVLDEYHRGQR